MDTAIPVPESIRLIIARALSPYPVGLQKGKKKMRVKMSPDAIKQSIAEKKSCNHDIIITDIDDFCYEGGTTSEGNKLNPAAIIIKIAAKKSCDVTLERGGGTVFPPICFTASMCVRVIID